MRLLEGLGHDVGEKGAYLLHLGSGDWAVTMRLIGARSIEAGTHGPVRIRLPQPLPLLPGDRFVLREAGRQEVIGGGLVLDVDPVLPLRRARPDTRVERVITERGWVPADVLDRLTGHRAEPTVGEWVVDPDVLTAAVESLSRRIISAGASGIDLAELSDHERALLSAHRVPNIVVEFGNARSIDAPDPLEQHPWVKTLLAAPFAPPPPLDVDPAQLRLMQRRGTVIMLDGLYFHSTAVERAGEIVTQLLSTHPNGVTVSQVRDALGSSRKHVLPLLNRLDARGITRRQGDLRVGPHQPS